MLSDSPTIEGVVTGTAGFAGGGGAAVDPPELLTSPADFERRFGEAPIALGRLVHGFFDNGGTRAYVAGALAALEVIDDIELLCPLPEDNKAAIAQCERRRDRFAILSLPAGLDSVEEVLAARPPESAFAAVHHPWVNIGRPAVDHPMLNPGRVELGHQTVEQHRVRAYRRCVQCEASRCLTTNELRKPSPDRLRLEQRRDPHVHLV